MPDQTNETTPLLQPRESSCAALPYLLDISQVTTRLTDEWRQSQPVSIFEPFVWLNGKTGQMEILLIITERPDRLALLSVDCFSTAQPPKDDRWTWTPRQSEQRWKN